MKSFVVAFLPMIFQIAVAQNITDVPMCAQTCLANATNAQTDCTGVDVKCLCTTNDYVNALSCCLATECGSIDQQRAIAFNIATCKTVNESAPNFVGCSPGSVEPPEVSPSTTNSLLSTVTGRIEAAQTTLIGTSQTVASFDGRPLLTGSCSQPYFAQVTDLFGDVTQFPAVGCSNRYSTCCPFDFRQNAAISKCPQDYITTADACCPSGYSIYFTDIGGQTPCVTAPSVTLVPMLTSTVSEVTIMTDHLFARKFDLPKRGAAGSQPLGVGAIAGIAIGCGALVALLSILLFFLIQRRKAKMAKSQVKSTPIALSGDMALPSPVSATHELASPVTPLTHRDLSRNPWPSPSSPPAYEGNMASTRHKAQQEVQELPGDGFIFQHHPAYAGTGSESTTTRVPSPPRTPARSPELAPHAQSTSPEPVVSPLGSPQQPSK